MVAPTHPYLVFSAGGPSYRPSSATIEYSMDSLSGRGTFQFPGNTQPNPPGGTYGFPAVQLNQYVTVVGGYQGISLDPLFAGYIEDDGSRFSGTALANTITCGDRLRLMQYPIGDPFVQATTVANRAAVYDSVLSGDIDATTGQFIISGQSPDYNGVWDDISIAQDLFTRAGVGGGTAIGGAGVLMATQAGIILSNQETPESLLTRIDQATGCKSFSTANGVVRMATTFSPTAGQAWLLRQGFEILEIDNQRTTRKFFNRVIVLGIKVGAGQIMSIRSAPANLPPAPGQFGLLYSRPNTQPITKTYQSDLIQSQSMADNLSASMLSVGNRVEERYTIKTAFESKAQPGQTVAVLAPAAKIYSTVNGFCLAVKHTFDSSGAFTIWTVAIYTGGLAGNVISSSPPTVGTYPPIVSGPFRTA